MEREVSAYKTMPSYRQLFELARIGVCLAKDQGKMHESRLRENAHMFLADELHYVDLDPCSDYKEISHRFTGRIARVGFRQWSMRIAEPYWVNSAENEDGYRAVYLFEWSDTETTKSSRWLKAKDVLPIESGEGQPTDEDFLYVNPGFIHAVSQYESVSASDVKQLIDRMETFAETSRSCCNG